MSTGTTTHVVLGATGGIGSAIVDALVEAGRTTVAVNRAGDAAFPPVVERRAADVGTEEGAAAAVAGASVVYMAAQPAYHRWAEEFPPMLATVIDAVEAVGAKLVMVDNAYVYGPGASPMTEATPERATDRKGVVRREMTRMLLAARDRGAARIVVGRVSDYFGPSAENSVIAAITMRSAASERGPLRWMGALDQPRSVAYLPDVGRAFVTLGTDDRSDGEIWHLPHPSPVTGHDFLGIIDDVAGTERAKKALGKMMLRIAAPFHSASRESLHILYQWTEPFILDDTKFEQAFGPFDRTPLHDAVAETLGRLQKV